MIEVIIFLILTVFMISVGLFLVILTICLAWNVLRRNLNEKHVNRLKKAIFLFLFGLFLNVGLVSMTQIFASSPTIIDDSGNGIAELSRLKLNGRKQWISIRSHDTSKPVLLFLAGGPGGTQMAAVRHELSELEKHFVMVNWDQPGSGKSYNAIASEDITLDTYIKDAYALTLYLKERFGQDKIYLIGESWGSALGIFLIDKYPEHYHALIGTGQMVDFLETERIDYALALKIAKEKNDSKIIKRLEKNGEPPYYGKDVTWKSAVYLNYLSNYMASNPNIHNAGYNTLRDIFSYEYGILDKINYIRGIINTYNHVYPKLYGIDLRKDYKRLEVPVYFFEGRYDVNAPTSLVEEYYQILDAPIKEIVWFEHSGHSPWMNETEKFVQEVLKRFK